MRLWILVLAVAAGQAGVAVFPAAEIAARDVTATVYLPHPSDGYYRGTRFDWSGAIARLTWKGHDYFGEWFERHDPLLHDGITGPVEEFQAGDSSVGYDEAKAGETFIRVGVGAVRKPAEAAYRRFATYEIVDAGRWSVRPASDRVTFVHTLDAGGYGYVFTKVVRVADGALVIDHSLQNTGRKPIVTAVYNHNFFTLDRQPTGPDVAVRLGFDARPLRPLGALGTLKGRELTFTRVLQQGENVFTELEGFGASAADYDIRVENRKTGAGVHITADRPIVKFVFWSAPKTVCPEPYVDASVQPGATSSWRITYDFYEAR